MPVQQHSNNVFIALQITRHRAISNFRLLILISNYPPPWPYPSLRTIAGKTTTIRHSGRIILDITSRHNLGINRNSLEKDVSQTGLVWTRCADLYFELRQSMEEKWTCHPLAALPLPPPSPPESPLVWIRHGSRHPSHRP